RCHELRVRDEKHNWRIVYRLDSDAIVILEVFPKTTKRTPKEVIRNCQRRLRLYDEAKKKPRNKSGGVAMEKETRARLEAAGLRVGSGGEFLGLTDQEARLVELRLSVSRAVRKLREALGVTQQHLAKKLQSSQSRIAKIEAAAEGVSLDLSFR